MDCTCQCTDMIPDQYDCTNIIANNKFILPLDTTPKPPNKTIMTSSNIHTINKKNCNLPFLHETNTAVDSSSPSDSNLPSYDPFNPRMIGPRYCEYCHAQSTLNCNPNICDRPTLYFKRQPPPFRNGYQDENNMNTMNGYDSSSHSEEMDKVITMGSRDNYGRRAYWAQNSKQGQWRSSHSFKQKQQQLVFQSRRQSSTMLDSGRNGDASLSHLLDNNGDESSIGQDKEKDGQVAEDQESMSPNKEGAIVISKDGDKTISSPGKLNLFNMFCSSV